ncbi:MAG: sodium:calcium antiporter [Candidatus Micrarchaeota archaeon]
MVLVELAILLFSIIILSRSSEMVISSSVRLSRFFNLNPVAMGFLLVAIATSLPELSVSVTSSLAGEGAISAGNVFGSNIANIFIVLGIGGLLYGMKISQSNLKDIAIVLLLTTLISIYIIYGSSVSLQALGIFEGAILILIFLGYVWWTLKMKKQSNGNHQTTVSKAKALRAFISFFIGIFLVIISSAFAVGSAVTIATSLGLAQSFIGATIIALGTSLPELSTALQALRKKQYGLVLGNVVGSNMANLTMVLGVASTINPISVQLPVFIAALLFAVVANTLLFYCAAVNKGIGKFAGAVFVLTYVVYIVAIFGLQATEVSVI